jgi:hypothetical protein
MQNTKGHSECKTKNASNNWQADCKAGLREHDRRAVDFDRRVEKCYYDGASRPAHGSPRTREVMRGTRKLLVIASAFKAMRVGSRSP